MSFTDADIEAVTIPDEVNLTAAAKFVIVVFKELKDHEIDHAMVTMLGLMLGLDTGDMKHVRLVLAKLAWQENDVKATVVHDA